MSAYSILKLRLQQERHVVHARQRARDLAALLGFERQDQVRLATATSELTRNAFRYARDSSVQFLLSDELPASLIIEVKDSGPGIHNLQEILNGHYESKTGLGKGLTGTRRLMDGFRIESSERGTCVVVSKVLPNASAAVTAQRAADVANKIAEADLNPFQEVERQNQELLRTLAELREKQDLLAQVNSELGDTNRGVVALYAELEQSATDLRRVSDQKTSFLSNLSHEFRTPLNAILSLCNILNSRADGELTEEQEKQVGYIRRSAADLSELVNDLLDVAKVEAGKVDIKPAMFSLEEMFGGLRGMLRTLLTSTAVELTFHTMADLPAMFSDEPKITQILRNLISNAIKFTERGQVRVSALLDDDTVVLEVADTGIGIAPEDQERIFEEFVQVSGLLQSQLRGTGLGLPLSRKLAELLGGSLRVSSTAGAGSTFTVRLPLHFRDFNELPQTPIVPTPDTRVVLIVEDNAETRFIHETSLRGSPYALLFARNISEARGVVASEAPVAIVLDRMLEGVDALSFLSDLRGQGYRGKVVVVSVIDEPGSALDAGADAFLLKPIASGVLAETLARLLGGDSLRTLLLVDDDEINRYVLSEALAPFRLHLVEARSGREALEIGAQSELAGVFLDMSMPGFTGLETLREFRCNPVLSKVPVIIHTSRELTDNEQAELRSLGAWFFPKQKLTDALAHELLQFTLKQAGVL